MQRSVNDLIDYSIAATDGELGRVDEFYFDDKLWVIRYLVVATERWLPEREVLISPVALGKPDWESRTFPVKLTKKQVQNSPDIDRHKTVTRQHEEELFSHYGWPVYWGEGYYTGPIYGMDTPIQPAPLEKDAAKKEKPEPHLCSTRSVSDYHIHALDGEIGHVADFIVDDDTWKIRYIVVDTRNWWPGKKILISPLWIKQVNWLESEVYVDLSREVIKNSPAYDHTKPISGEYEDELSDYYEKSQNLRVHRV